MDDHELKILERKKDCIAGHKDASMKEMRIKRITSSNIVRALQHIIIFSSSVLFFFGSTGGRCLQSSSSFSSSSRATPRISIPSYSTYPIGSTRRIKSSGRIPILVMNSSPPPSPSSSSGTSPAKSSRIELFFKNPQDLKDRVVFLQQALDVHKFNLVNKHKSDAITEWIDCIRDVCPRSHICCHYSLKYQKIPRVKSQAEQITKLMDFLKTCDADEVLIVNGSGPKSAQWSTVQALQSVTHLYRKNDNGESDNRKNRLPTLAVAYNPFFPSKQDQREENERLKQKLQTGCVSKVYFQFGSDLDRLKQGIEFCHSLIHDDNYQSTTKTTLAGSLFLPTKQLIAQQKFRPWNGVFLSPEFLSGPDNAQGIVLEMMKLYDHHNIEFLWEAPGVKSQKDVDVLMSVFSSRGSTFKSSHTDDLRNQASTLASTPTVPQTKRAKLSSDRRETGQGSVGKSSKQQFEKVPPETVSPVEKSSEPALLLFGSHDVRLRDNRAVEAAMKHHSFVVPVFLWTPEDRGTWGVRGAAQVLLKDALRNLDATLRSFDLSLVCANCKSNHGVNELVGLVKSCGITAVYYNKEFTPEGRERDAIREAALRDIGIQVYVSQSSLLYDPDLIELSSGFHGGHWGTLMPFLKNCKKQFGEPPTPTPYHDTFRLLQETNQPMLSLSLTNIDDESDCWVPVDSLDMAIIDGRQQWGDPIRQRFQMSTEAAYEAMEGFVTKGIARYEKERSRADIPASTSELSPHLRFGTISCNELYWRIESSGLGYDKLKTFSRRLFWRDLAYFQLKCFPNMRTKSIRTHYDKTAWIGGQEEERRFNAWRRGQTGYPLVDAGMRELWETGFMTQSIRIVVASFLVEYLRVNWTKGCEWFHYTLADADSAINAMMWQNAGRSGIDQWNWVSNPQAKPASQDPTAVYTRRWVPELARLPTSSLVHRPWEAPYEVLEEAGVILGETYPKRIVEDLTTELQLSVESTLATRRASQEFNTDRGYDLIELPNGEKTVVFTKKAYRIDSHGNLIKDGRNTTDKIANRSTLSGKKSMKRKSKRAARAM